MRWGVQKGMSEVGERLSTVEKSREPSPSSGAAQEKNKTETPAKECCPVCGEVLLQEKCKVVCRSALCGYRIVYNCSEF